MGRFASSTNSANMITLYKTSSYTAKANERILVNTESNVLTVTLPNDSSLNTGDIIQVIDVGYALSVRPVTITSTALYVDNVVSDITMDLTGSTVTFIWYSHGGQNRWAICA